MFDFLHKLWNLTRPYRGRLMLGVLTGIVGGIIEPIMIATVALVYGMIFPSAETNSALLTKNDIRKAPALVAKLNRPTEPVTQFLSDQFTPDERRTLTNAVASSDAVPGLLLERLNHLVQCGFLYDSQRFAGVKLSGETEVLLVKNPSGENLIRLNRLLLEDVYPAEIRRGLGSFMSDQLKLAPAFVREWAVSAERALTIGVKTHPWAVVLLVTLIPAVILLRSVFSYLNVYFLQWTAVRTITDLRVRLFEHLINLSAGFFSKTTTGELMARVMADTAALQNIISGATSVMVKDPVTVLALLGYLIWQQPRITLISMVVMPVCMVPIIIYNRKVRRSSRALQTHYAELSSVMAESFSGHRVIKAYNLEPTMVDRFRTVSRKFIGHVMRIVRSSEIPGPLLEFVGAVGVSLVLIYLAFQERRPTGTDFLKVILSIFTLYRPLKNLTRLYNNLEQARAASSRVFELLEVRNEVVEPAHPRPIQAVGAAIHFDHVSFSYGDKPVLVDVDLKVEPGKMVAVVGPSGAGKTSLTNLLMRFYDPQQGAVRIGGLDIREATTRDLRNHIAVVTQETVLFNDTVARNIELGRPGASEAEIIQAAQRANAYDFIMAKPDGFQCPVGERGNNLSGGQRQRIAISRALLKNAPILILDEATSSLDTESERVFQAELEKLMEGRTTICIAHRLSTVQKADQIVVLSEGRVVESGTHDELLRAQGLYHKLYQMQFRT